MNRTPCHVSQTAVCALQATAFLAQRGRHANTETILAKCGGSLKFLRCVLSLLRKRGILASIPGALGGYRLLREDLSMLDVIEAVDGRLCLDVVTLAGNPLVDAAGAEITEFARKKLDAIALTELR